ncbi:MAG: DMT family transporter, partial [Xanthomonadales bacterium]|nr:DMT family transporter [Xanthomonadales bacterium]
MRLGVAVGTLSALLVAIFGSLNKRYVLRGDPLAVTGLEMAAGVLVLSLLAPWLVQTWPGLTLPWQWPAGDDLWLLLLLALGCTLLPFALSLVALRQLSAFSAQLAINLEPVYAILLAMLLLGEQTELSLSFYLGVAVLLLGVFIHPLLTRRAIAGPGDEPTRTAD